MEAPNDPLTDLELLALKIALNLDDQGRLADTYGVTLGVAGDGQRLFVGSGVPDALVPVLVEAVRSTASISVDREPTALNACRAVLEPVCGLLSLEAGPVYAIEPPVRTESQICVLRSDASGTEPLRNPGNWEANEWDDLLNGICGPWAMAVVDGRVVSICHTPLPMTAHAAECGDWTDPDFRGRGYAAAVTAAWADIVGPTRRRLFYSTDAENHASQRLAARLALRSIGWTWHLTPASATRSNRHPLSRPRT